MLNDRITELLRRLVLLAGSIALLEAPRSALAARTGTTFADLCMERR